MKSNTKLTSTQIKLKKVLKPIVESMLKEQEKEGFDEFLDIVQQEFSKSAGNINRALRKAQSGNEDGVTNILKNYFNTTRKPNYDDAIVVLVDYFHGVAK